MSDNLIAIWHNYQKNPSDEALRALLHDDVEFISPVVFTPQRGKDITVQYLSSAGNVFDNTGFKYTNEIQAGNRVVLEFECTMNGKYVNGVDIIDFNEDGLITQFKVMVRPLQAVNLVWEQMGVQLEQASA